MACPCCPGKPDWALARCNSFRVDSCRCAGAATRVNVLCFEGLLSVLSPDDTQVVQTRDGPAFCCQASWRNTAPAVRRVEARSDDSKSPNMTQTELDRQPKTGHRARAVSSNARSEAATTDYRYQRHVQPSSSIRDAARRVQQPNLRAWVAACLRARDGLIATHIDSYPRLY